MLLSSAVSVLILLASPFIVISNGLIISVWIRFKRLRTPSNALLLSLAAADLGFGLFLPVAIALDLTFTEECSASACIGPFAILLTFCAASLLSMTAIGLDRFTSVSQPLRYNHFVTMSNVHKFICACWTYAVVLGVGMPLLFLQHISAEVVIGWLAIFLYGPCLISAIISYGYIYVIARNHARAIYSVEVSLHNGSTCEITDRHILGHGHANRYGLTLAMILGSIIGCWLPIQVCAFVDLFSGNMILMDRQWRLLAALPLVISSFMNPWLYGYRSSEVRLAIIRLIDSIVTKITGRPDKINILYTYHKGDLTSCASNVRLLAISPTNTTVQCCSHSPSPSPSPNCDRKQSNLSIHLMICDQVSSL